MSDGVGGPVARPAVRLPSIDGMMAVTMANADRVLEDTEAAVALHRKDVA